MRRKYQTPPKELQRVFNYEWKRAKKICAPLLDNSMKPRLYVCDKLSNPNWVGMHRGRDGLFVTRIGNSFREGMRINQKIVKTDHLIAIRKDHASQLGTEEGDRLINTIRHEICHVLHQNHKAGFQLMLKGLCYQSSK